jgi:hypothetical protein
MTHIEPMTESKLTSVRIPQQTLQALQRRAKRLDISQNKLIVSLLNQALGLGDEGFDPNPPLPTDEEIANLTARVKVLEQRLGDEAAVSEPPKTQPEEPLPIIEAIANKGLLTKSEAVKLAIERGLAPCSEKITTPAVKRFGNAYSDYYNPKGKSKKNPEEMWGLQRVTAPDGKGYLFKDLRA